MSRPIEPLEFRSKERDFAIYFSGGEQVAGVALNGIPVLDVAKPEGLTAAPLRNLVFASVGMKVSEAARLTYRSPDTVKSLRLAASRYFGTHAMEQATGMAFAKAIYQITQPIDALPLQPRQLDVLDLITQGLNEHEIADQLGIKPSTVHTQRRQSIRNTGSSNVVQTVFLAHLSGQLPLRDSRPFGSEQWAESFVSHEI